jgi:hypothetical protein
MTAKKKTTATAMAPNTVMIFTVMCGVAPHNLILPLNSKRVTIFDICFFPKLSLY